jgi:hypothetical protein
MSSSAALRVVRVRVADKSLCTAIVGILVFFAKIFVFVAMLKEVGFVQQPPEPRQLKEATRGKGEWTKGSVGLIGPRR